MSKIEILEIELRDGTGRDGIKVISGNEEAVAFAKDGLEYYLTHDHHCATVKFSHSRTKYPKWLYIPANYCGYQETFTYDNAVEAIECSKYNYRCEKVMEDCKKYLIGLVKKD